jgi:ribosomal protein S18 acetylase RimI-like enzyme
VGEIITRTATLADLPVLLTFEQGIITAERPFDVTIKDGEVHYYDIAYMITAPHVKVCVAEIDGELIGSGYARIEDSKVYLKHAQHAFMGFMYVKPEYRGRGVNNLIIQTLTDWSRQHGTTEIRLEVYNDNQAAIRAYEKTGFFKLMLSMRKGLEAQPNPPPERKA